MILALRVSTPVQGGIRLPLLARSPVGQEAAHCGWNKACEGKKETRRQTKTERTALNLFEYLKVADKRKGHCSPGGSDKKHEAITLRGRCEGTELGELMLSLSETSRRLGWLQSPEKQEIKPHRTAIQSRPYAHTTLPVSLVWEFETHKLVLSPFLRAQISHSCLRSSF